MATIVIKTQKDLDNLPKKFDEFTYIEIRSNDLIIVKDCHMRESSRVVAWESSSVVAHESSRVEARESSRVVARESSSVVAWGSSSVVAHESSSVVAHESSSVVAHESSRVEAWGSSRVKAWGSSEITNYLMSVVFIYSLSVKIKKLYDKSTAKLMCDYDVKKIEDKHKTAQIVKQQKDLDFETYLERGWVKADGILQRLVKKKKFGSLEVFEVEDYNMDKSFVVKKGDIFSHGTDLEKAKNDLKYKTSSRDTSEFRKWKLKDKKSVDDLIRSYRAITGACEFGVKNFCESKKLKTKYSIQEVVELTKGHFGADKFEEFFV